MMTKKTTLATTVTTILYFAVVTSAFAKIDQLEGRKAITANASYQITSVENQDDDSKTSMATLGFSYYPKNFLETKLAMLGMKVESGDFDTTIYSLAGVVNFNLFKPGWVAVPYIGGQLGISGYDAGEYDDTALSYGGQGGVKFFLSEDLSLNVELNYLMTTVDAGEGEELDVDNTSVLLGFSYYF
ncbi:MAG: outer membrane beta-barrel protein [Thermodesulfobacteriota bacterium]